MLSIQPATILLWKKIKKKPIYTESCSRSSVSPQLTESCTCAVGKRTVGEFHTCAAAAPEIQAAPFGVSEIWSHVWGCNYLISNLVWSNLIVPFTPNCAAQGPTFLSMYVVFGLDHSFLYPAIRMHCDPPLCSLDLSIWREFSSLPICYEDLD